MTGRLITNQHGHKLHCGGRKRPVVTPASHPHLFKSAKQYLNGVLPTAPDYDYFANAGAGISDILGNDTLGDCTAAGACHLVEVFCGNAGSPVVLTRDDAIGFYSLSTGYDPNDPSTDQGGDEVQVCDTWRDKGLDGKGTHKIVGRLSVDPTNIEEIRSTGWLFEGHYFGAELDANWPNQVQGNGFVWSSGTPSPNEGHCFVGAKATKTGIGIDSWGFLGEIEYPTIAKFCADSVGGNLFVIVSEEIINRASQKAPNAYNWMQLLADLQALGGLAP